MGLIDRLQPFLEPRSGAAQPSLLGHDTYVPAATGGMGFLSELRTRVQDRLVEQIDVTKIEEAGYAALLDQIGHVIDELIEQDKVLRTPPDRTKLIKSVTNDMLGLGPLEPLLQDHAISDIMVNGHGDVWIERDGRLVRTDVRFHDDVHLMMVINRIVARVGRRIDEASPMVDARLPDGSRVSAIIPPLALHGPGLSIRRFGAHHIQIYDLVRNNSLTDEMAEFFRLAVSARLNLIVAGGTPGIAVWINLRSFALSKSRPAAASLSLALGLHWVYVARSGHTDSTSNADSNSWAGDNSGARCS